MKTAASITLLSALAIAPMAHAADSTGAIDRIVTAASEHGITHFNELEFEDDEMTEVEGWMDGEWYTEIKMTESGEVIREKREKRIDGVWGMSADQVRNYAEAAFGEGMTRIEGIEVDEKGHVEVEGDGDSENGKDGDGEMKVYFRLGDTSLSNVTRD
ncbi:PepSY domain-containing protein [Spiribacter vilamensis]|uniref:YpeB-like protein with putative protease inhibitory function n=1 Tax=Spiribacter vilamensis TaxID=531306 RepID=A0A4Q8CZJ1_9GAMM|nr:PepSY domain-containing protein [Spiribacter vilamensis]RZU98404.1 YpeB-like protein with putative protease inhibitory function [Spiribacter vilamensis]TVO60717.1 PepSY domain-containing protein [Spiribacter vilamensis]